MRSPGRLEGLKTPPHILNILKTSREETTMPEPQPLTKRVTCRYLRRNGEQCTGEAVDSTADVLLCITHMARVVEHARAITEETTR